MTGALIRKLDAGARPKPEKTAPPQREPSPIGPGEASGAKSSEVSGNITSLHKLALAYYTQRNYEAAERAYLQALAAIQASARRDHPELSQLLNNLGRLYFDQKRYQDAEPLYSHSLAIVEKEFGGDHPKVARRLVNLADLYFATGKHSEADACYRRAVSIEEREFGLKHPTTMGRLRSYAVMLRNMGKLAEAEAMEARAYFPRPGQERRSMPDRRFQEVPTSLQGISVPDRRRRKLRRTGQSRRRS